jgi:hypothetical protein
MNKEGGPQEYWELPIEEQLELQDTQLDAITEATYITHVAKYGERPNYGIPIMDALLSNGCPCWQCARDDFL